MAAARAVPESGVFRSQALDSPISSVSSFARRCKTLSCNIPQLLEKFRREPEEHP